MSDTKPREFNIFENRCNLRLRAGYKDDYDDLQPNDDIIHVIEHSAYESMKAERDELKRKLGVAVEAMKKFDDGFIKKYSPGENWFPIALVISKALKEIEE